MTSPHNVRSGEPHFYSDLPPTYIHAVCLYTHTGPLPNTQLYTFTQAEHTITVSLLEQKPLYGSPSPTEYSLLTEHLCG